MRIRMYIRVREEKEKDTIALCVNINGLEGALHVCAYVV